MPPGLPRQFTPHVQTRLNPTLAPAQEIAGHEEMVGQYESYKSFTMPQLYRVVEVRGPRWVGRQGCLACLRAPEDEWCMSCAAWWNGG